MTKKQIRLYIMLGLLVLILLLAVFGKNMVLNDPYRTDLSKALITPCQQYPFGTDNLGRCIYSRILEGASTSIYSALIVVAIVFAFGTMIGMTSAYFGGIWDNLTMKVTMIFQAFPSFILAVAVAGMMGPGIRNAMISLVVMYWTTYARLARSLVLKVKEEPYIKAAKICGAGKTAILIKYIFPNIVSPLIITAALDIGNVILSMAGLSFLGLGAQPPLAEWGIMISNARSYLQIAPWYVIFPSLALFVIVLLFNLTGDCIRDCLDKVV